MTKLDIPQIAWQLSGVSDHDFMRQWSLQHRCVQGAELTLCGQRVPWYRVAPGDRRRCKRCDRLADRLLQAPSPRRSDSGASNKSEPAESFVTAELTQGSVS